MAILVGIDEAGYGPILGPMVVSCAAFRVPDELVGADLWRELDGAVGRSRRRLAGRLLVADSKKAYNRSAGIGHLRRTVLACLQCLGERPATAAELLRVVCPDCVGRISEYPWYQELAGQPLGGERADIEIAAGALARGLSAKKAELLCLRSRCVDVAHYNHTVAAVRNKSEVLFAVLCGLIKEAFDNLGGDEVQVIIDRQGGRMRYRRALMRMFGPMELVVLREDERDSSYELAAGGRKMRLHFAVGADDKFLPVSLASMASKLVREIMVGCINEYFCGRCEGLRPTAGYWKDGLRFIKDLKSHPAEVQYHPEQLIRCR